LKSKYLRFQTSDRKAIILGSVDNFLENLKTIVKPLGKVLGKNIEVVLHDLRHLNKSIIEIANGHVTGRKIGNPIIGGPVQDEGLKIILEKSINKQVIDNYISYTPDGRKLKSTSIFFLNSKKEPIAALCINLDLTQFAVVDDLITDILKIEEEPAKPNASSGKRETSSGDIGPTMKMIAAEAISDIQKPIRLAEKREKVEAVRKMYERGLFLLKGGVDYAAAELGVSRFTIYNYLKELKYRFRIQEEK